MDEGAGTLKPSAVNGTEEDEGLGSFRFPSIGDEHDLDDIEEREDGVSELSTPPPTLDSNPLQEAHPGSKLLRWLFGAEFLLMIPLLPLEMLVSEAWSLTLILIYSSLIVVHLIIGLSMFGLLYDPWHNNIVKALKIHQGSLAICSMLMLMLFSYLIFIDSMFEGHDLPDEIGSTLGQKGRTLPYHIGSATVWIVTFLICARSFLTLTRERFDITTGTGCCPVIRCRACRVTCFLGLPDAAVGIRYHHHGESGSKWDEEGISINTYHKREVSLLDSKPRKLPLPGEDGQGDGSAHFDKRGSVDYFAPIWKTTSVDIPTPRRDSIDDDKPRLSGSAPSDWRGPISPPIDVKRKEFRDLASRSVGNTPIFGHPGKTSSLRSPLLAHVDET